jgi:Kef-type K+ transport system membrane component KefB
MQFILPLGGWQASTSLLTFGFLILAAYTVGEIATSLRLPKILGYLAAGLLFGPAGLDTVTYEATRELAPVSNLAVALIAFLAGAELQWGEVKQRGVAILKILSTELTIDFLAIWGLLFALRDLVPFLQGTRPGEAAALASLFAVIAIVHSPAVTMALLTETQARGEVARTTLGVVLVADVVVVLLFSLTIALVRGYVPPPGDAVAPASLAMLAWEIGGSVLVGAALGAAVALYLRFVRSQLFLFAIVVTFFGAELARIAHTEVLLTLLVAGFVSENAGGEHGVALRHAMERAAAPVFVVFFALAGAKIAVHDVVMLLPLVLPIAVTRVAALWAGAALGTRWARMVRARGRYVWMGLVSQAGVAIGLATIVAEAYPGRGAQMRTLFLAVIAINETVGPVFFRHALTRTGEVAEAEEGEAPIPAEPAGAH